jgi:hypothetical protein
MVLTMTVHVMNEAIEKLKALQKRKSDAFNKCEADIQFLEMEKRELSSQIDGIDQAIKELSGPPGGAVAADQPALIGKYTKMKLTPAVLDVLETTGAAPGLFVPEVIGKLRAEGYKSNVKNLYASVYAVALRLVKDGKAREGKKDGRRTFMKKEL